jgi:MYXO-CTERM domain-containing protein
VISNVEVVQVSWSDAVDPKQLADGATFYQALLATDYLEWLSEYDTVGKVGFVDQLPGSAQHIGPGTFRGTVTITPTSAAVALDDADIQAELAAQLKSGALPPPSLDADGRPNTLYVLEFPPGVAVTLLGFASCAGFFGYHFTIPWGSTSVPYVVMPSCGLDADGGTFTRSHELVEAITNTDAGLLPDALHAPSARPLAWVAEAPTYWEAPESADLCKTTIGHVAGYAVATSWSNAKGACVTRIPAATVPPAAGGAAGTGGMTSAGAAGSGGLGGRGGAAGGIGATAATAATEGGCALSSADVSSSSPYAAIVLGLAAFWRRVRRARPAARATRSAARTRPTSTSSRSPA